jgi:hypothetical protein
MEKLTKLKIRVVSSTALLIFAIFGFLSVNGSLAWFSNNKQVTSNGMQLQSVIEELIIADYEIYYYDVSDGAGKRWENEEESAIMREYDSVFTDRNENTSLIFKIPIQGPYIREGKAFTVTLDCTQALYETDAEGAQTNNVADYLSNVVQIKASAITALKNETDANIIYTQATEHFKTVEKDNEKEFVLVSDNTATKNVSITFTIENYGASTSMDLYIEMDYSPELIKYYLGHRDGKLSSGWLSNEVMMSNDISRISLGVPQE